MAGQQIAEVGSVRILLVRYRKQRFPVYPWVTFTLYRLYNDDRGDFRLTVWFAGLSPQHSYGNNIGALVDGWEKLKVKRGPIKKELRKLYASFTGNV
jgi:hypothetical protein